MDAHGQRLLPSTIDAIAKRHPQRTWASMRQLESSEYVDISISTYANAINSMLDVNRDRVYS